MITRDLVEFGLSEKEAKVYIALLKLEVASVNEISKKSEVNRSTTYVTLDSLTRRGFVTVSNDKNVKCYSAVSPEVLLRSVENDVIKYGNIKEKIEKIVPEMMALHKDTKQRPIVKVYEGKQGLISAFQETLKCKEKMMRVFSSPENLGGLISNYMQEYVQKRFISGVRMRGIHPDTEVHRGLTLVLEKIFGKQARSFDSYILIPQKKYKFPADIAIYDNTVGYMTKDHGGIAISVESKEMADIMKNIFDLAWEEAKRIRTN